jgi:hypothetical protein
LRRTKEVFTVFGGEEDLVVTCYTDVSFQTNVDDCKLQSDFVFCLNGGVVSWKRSNQDIVVDSITKAKYVGAFDAAMEVVWIRNFVFELGVVPSASRPMDLYCDNSRAIAQAKQPRSLEKSKHVLWHFQLIHKIINRGDVKVCMLHMDQNVADPLMKPLPQPKHEAHMRSMGIRYLHE